MMIVSELEKEIYSLKGINTLNLSVKAIEIINNVAKKVKEYICCNGFKNIEEEILFFKELKPILYSKLIYYTELKEIESKRVSFVSNEYVRVYLLEHTQRLMDYLNDNIYTYQYLKLGSTFLDAALFTWKNVLESSRVSDYDLDVSFMTVWDDKVSRIRAYEMLLAYLNYEISRLDKPYPPSELIWHGSKRGNFNEVPCIIFFLLYHLFALYHLLGWYKLWPRANVFFYLPCARCCRFLICF